MMKTMVAKIARATFSVFLCIVFLSSMTMEGGRLQNKQEKATKKSSSGKANRDFLIDDFEDGDLMSLRNSQWQAYSDKVIGGKSEAKIEIISDGAAGSLKALRLTGKITKDVQFGFAGVVVALDSSGKEVDVNKYEGIQFYTRGDGNVYVVQLGCTAVTDHNEFSFEFVTDKDWKLIKVPFKKLKQSPYFGRLVKWTGKDVKAIYFQTGASYYPSLKVEIDEIEFF